MIFTPTIKQQEAIEKMETFCKINSHRTNFSTKNEFDLYFELLKKRWNKRAKLLNDVSSWKTSYNEINKKISAKKEKYYSDEWSLKSYAIKYINRYFPTIKQLELQLSKKTKDYKVVKTVVDMVKQMIDEEKMIDNLVSTLKDRGKNINYITTKLYNKRFDWGLIKDALNKLKAGKSLLIQYTLEEKITYYKKKWKSKFEIGRKFIERHEDRELVEEILEKVFWEDWESDVLKEKIIELKRKNNRIKKKKCGIKKNYF